MRKMTLTLSVSHRHVCFSPFHTLVSSGLSGRAAVVTQIRLPFVYAGTGVLFPFPEEWDLRVRAWADWGLEGGGGLGDGGWGGGDRTARASLRGANWRFVHEAERLRPQVPRSERCCCRIPDNEPGSYRTGGGGGQRSQTLSPCGKTLSSDWPKLGTI